jgi:hypothetical protein
MIEKLDDARRQDIREDNKPELYAKYNLLAIGSDFSFGNTVLEKFS